MWQQGFSQGEEGLCLLQDVWKGDPVLQVFSNQSLQLLHSGAAFPLQRVEFTAERNKTMMFINTFIWYFERIHTRSFIFHGNGIAALAYLKSCSFMVSWRARSAYGAMSMSVSCGGKFRRLLQRFGGCLYWLRFLLCIYAAHPAVAPLFSQSEAPDLRTIEWIKWLSHRTGGMLYLYATHRWGQWENLSPQEYTGNLAFSHRDVYTRTQWFKWS